MISQRMKTLIHVHTNYSFDSDVSLETLAAFVENERVRCIAITDHDTIDGAVRFSRMTTAKVIVGEEVSTKDGHLIGLFLREQIRPGMSARETASVIRDQGGLVLLPHPFVAVFGCGLRERSYEIVDLVDAVEVNNAQNLLPGPDRKARHFAEQFGLPTFCGTDAHSRFSLAPCFQWMPDFDGTPAGFLNSLRRARLQTGRHPLSYFAAAAWRVVLHALWLPLPAGFGAEARSQRTEVLPHPVAVAA